ncbi:hypothetical protein LI168_12985, partial [Desulfovibrio desulfuricans]
RGDRQSFSQGARSVYAPLRFRSQPLFFHFLKLSFHREAKLFFFNREERLCSPSLQESTVIFVSAKILFACVSVNRFPLSRRAVMLLLTPQVNHYFNFLQINHKKHGFLAQRKLKIAKRHHRVKP